MALINTGDDSWLLEYNACEVLSREILEQLHLRDKEKAGSFAYDSLSGRVRIRLRQYSNEIGQLRSKLQLPGITSTLTNEEKERRLRQVEELQSRYIQSEAQFSRSKPGASNSSVVVDMSKTGWGDDDDDDDIKPKPRSNALENTPVVDLRAQQQEMLRAQDQGLESLSQVISRQKQIANVISGEVDDQNELLDDISSSMDRVDTRVRSETDMIRTIGRKDTTCGYWIVIIIIFIVILAVSFS